MHCEELPAMQLQGFLQLEFAAGVLNSREQSVKNPEVSGTENGVERRNFHQTVSEGSFLAQTVHLLCLRGIGGRGVLIKGPDFAPELQ